MRRFTKRGFTLVESLIVAGLILFLATVVVLNLGNQKSYREFSSTTEKIVAALNDARSRSIAHEGGAEWRVRFRATTTTEPTYSICKGNQSDYFNYFSLGKGPNEQARYTLSKSVAIDASLALPGSEWSGITSCLGPYKDIKFSAIEGFPADPPNAWIKIYMVSGSAVSTTISVSPLGLVTFSTSSYWSGF